MTPKEQIESMRSVWIDKTLYDENVKPYSVIEIYKPAGRSDLPYTLIAKMNDDKNSEVWFDSKAKTISQANRDDMKRWFDNSVDAVKYKEKADSIEAIKKELSLKITDYNKELQEMRMIKSSFNILPS